MPWHHVMRTWHRKLASLSQTLISLSNLLHHRLQFGHITFRLRISTCKTTGILKFLDQ